MFSKGEKNNPEFSGSFEQTILKQEKINKKNLLFQKLVKNRHLESVFRSRSNGTS